MPAHIQIENLHFARGQRAIFAGVDMEIERGEVAAVVGPSGTGKTTLLRLISGQLRPDRGRILVDGIDVHQQSQSGLMALRKSMGMLFQSGALFTDMTVLENVMFPLSVHTDLSRTMIRSIALLKLEAVGLRGAADYHPDQLSGGMARRVALARAVALDPSLMLYDEPFVGQDPISMGALLRLIQTLNEALGITSVIVSHDLHETFMVADRVNILSQGVCIAGGPSEQIQSSTDPQVRQFISGHPDGPVPFHMSAVPLDEAMANV
ncbi:MAG: ABC transporter ATP-binding protein [Litorivicinus sp.]